MSIKRTFACLILTGVSDTAAVILSLWVLAMAWTAVAFLSASWAGLAVIVFGVVVVARLAWELWRRWRGSEERQERLEECIRRYGELENYPASATVTLVRKVETCKQEFGEPPWDVS